MELRIVIRKHIKNNHTNYKKITLRLSKRDVYTWSTHKMEKEIELTLGIKTYKKSLVYKRENSTVKIELL